MSIFFIKKNYLESSFFKGTYVTWYDRVLNEDQMWIFLLAAAKW